MKTVHELNQDELEELRSRWFCQHEDDGSLEEVLGEELYPCDEEDIDMSLIKTYYEDTLFVEEDFWCNLKESVMNKKEEIKILLIDNFNRLSMNIPSNFDTILDFVYADVEETADKENWNDSDVVIGLRRFLEQVD